MFFVVVEFEVFVIVEFRGWFGLEIQVLDLDLYLVCFSEWIASVRSCRGGVCPQSYPHPSSPPHHRIFSLHTQILLACLFGCQTLRSSW